MGYFVDEEERNYRKFWAPIVGGCVIFVIGLLFLLFGRGYGSDGTNYDLFLMFGSLLIAIGVLVFSIALLLQLRILFKGLQRTDQGPMAAYIPAQSAAGQIMRNTQIFSSAPPSTYDGGQKQGLPQQQQQPAAHQFSSAAAAYASGSMHKLKQSQESLTGQPKTASYQPPSYQQSYPQTERLPSQSTSSIGAPAPGYRQRQQPPMPAANSGSLQHSSHNVSQSTEI